MSSNSAIVGYYVYSLVMIGIFLYNCRSWAFIRVTLLYFIFITFFACLLIYGSAYSLESNLAQWHKEGWFATFPLTITGGAPDAHTIPKNSSTYWHYLIPLVAFFVTFPQAVARGASLHLSKERSPDAVMEGTIKAYNFLQQVLAFFKKSVPYVSGTLSDAYDIGEWVFVLLTLSSLVSPYSRQNWVLMLLGCFFIVLLAGSDIVGGKGLVSIILKLLIPGVISAMQRLLVFLLHLIVYAFGLFLAVITGFNLYILAEHIFHTQSLNGFVIVIILLLALGVLMLSFAFLWKVITFPAKKLIEWMEIEVIDAI